MGRAFLVETEEQLDAALDAAAKHTESYCLLDVHLDPMDHSAAMGRLADPISHQELVILTGYNFPSALRFRACAALSQINPKQAATLAADVLSESKENDDPSDMVGSFLQRKQGGDLLAAAISKKSLSADVAKQVLRAMYLAGKNDPKLTAVVGKQAGLDAATKLPSAEEIRSLGDEATAKGDPIRGERVFRRPDLGCMKCHALHKAGGNIGPDLGPVGGASPMDYIVQSILDPNASVKEEYLTRTIVTSAGQVLNGIVVEKTKGYTILKDATGKKIKIAAADIEEEAKGKTLMPEGVTRILTRGELLDLIRFVGDLGKPGPFAMPKDVMIKTWKRLKTVTVALKEGVPARDGLRDGVYGQPAEAFETVYSLVGGGVPLDELRKAGTPPQVVYLVGEIEVTRPGTLEPLRYYRHCRERVLLSRRAAR